MAKSILARIVGLVALAVAPISLHAASLTDDWQTCLSTVLNKVGAQNRTDAFGEYCVGLAYMQGHFGQKDATAAARYYAMAARQNQPGAEFALGYAYQRGYGVPRDQATAIGWYQKAAHGGSGDADFMLGQAYDRGFGVPKDPARAQSYYRAAAQLGNEEAKHLLVSAHFSDLPGTDLVRRGDDLRAKNDYTGAVAAFRQAAAMGNPYGEGSLGIMYEGGFGVPQSYQLAWQWYSKAANKGLPETEKRLGQLYELGEGVPENWALALAWYQKSAALHDQEGEFALGRMYEFGMAVPQSRSLAIKWFQAAANQGNSQGAYFARWLSVPSNNIGFRNNQEQAIVIKGRLPFVSGGDDPTGIMFHNSAQRVAWLQGLRRRESASEAQAMWQVRKDDYDKCTSSHGDNCRSPGPPPR